MKKKKLEAYDSGGSVSGDGKLVIGLVILVKKICNKKNQKKNFFMEETKNKKSKGKIV